MVEMVGGIAGGGKGGLGGLRLKQTGGHKAIHRL